MLSARQHGRVNLAEPRAMPDVTLVSGLRAHFVGGQTTGVGTICEEWTQMQTCQMWHLGQDRAVSETGGRGKEERAGLGQGPKEASRPVTCGDEAGTSRPVNQGVKTLYSFIFRMRSPVGECALEVLVASSQETRDSALEFTRG